MGESFPLVVAGGSVFVQIITSKKWCDLSGPRYAHSTFQQTSLDFAGMASTTPYSRPGTAFYACLLFVVSCQPLFCWRSRGSAENMMMWWLEDANGNRLLA